MTASFECDVEPDGEDKNDKTKAVRSTLVSRNVTIAGHRTSVRLEPEMWSGLSEICRRERTILHEVCTAVAARKQANTSLTAAIRVFVMAYFRAAATEDGHTKAGHGYGMGMNNVPTSSVGAAVAPRPTTGMAAFVMAGKIDGNRRF